MSKYTTGELAKLCDVSVRTVQYYDTRGILIPSELTEGGRRLYSENDLKKMKVICFLRDIGLPINSIQEILSESDPESVISILLDQQKEILRREIDERQTKLCMLEELKRKLKNAESVTVETIGDIAKIMKSKQKLFKLRIIMLILGIFLDIIEIGTLVLWITKGIWLPFAIGMTIIIAIGILMAATYYKRTAYICPQCHKVFRAKFFAFFVSSHTLNTRKLTCPECGHKGHCVETYETFTEVNE